VGLTRVTLIPRSPFRSRGPFQITHGRNVAAGAAEAEPPLTGLYKTHNSYGPATSKSSTLPHPHPPLNQKKKKKKTEKKKKEKKKNKSTNGSPSQRPCHHERRWQGDWWWKSLLHHLPCSPSSYSSTLNLSPHPPFTCRSLINRHQCFPRPIAVSGSSSKAF